MSLQEPETARADIEATGAPVAKAIKTKNAALRIMIATLIKPSHAELRFNGTLMAIMVGVPPGNFCKASHKRVAVAGVYTSFCRFLFYTIFTHGCKGLENMDSRAKRKDDRSFINFVSDLAFGGRTKDEEEPKNKLDGVLAELSARDGESEPSTDADRREAILETAPQAKLPQFDEAQRRATEHRQKIQAMLDHARSIEDMVRAEAAEAHALAQAVNLQEKRAAAARVIELELQATAHANDLARRSEAADQEEAQTAAALEHARGAVASAAAFLTECQATLLEAQKLVVRNELALRESEQSAKDAAALAAELRGEARKAAVRSNKCLEARESAEVQLREAEQLASNIAPSAATLERLRALETHANIPTGLEAP
jgi:hypothetical protein